MTTSRLSIEEQMLEAERYARQIAAQREAIERAAAQRAADIRAAREREIAAAQSAAALESSRTAQLDATRRETTEREARARETAAASEMAAARTAAALESSHPTRTPSLAERLGAPPTPTRAPTAPRPKPAVSRTPRLGEILSGEVPPELLARATAPTPSKPRPGGLEMAAASLQEERDVRSRNDALRRAYDVVPGGPEARAAIDDLVAGSRSAPITRSPSAPRPPSTQRPPRAPATQEHLVEERSRDRENRAIASTLPRGREAYDSFKREEELVELNGALRREILADPGGAAFLAAIDGQTAAPDQPDRGARRAALQREILADPGGAAHLKAQDAFVDATKLRFQDVVPEFGPQPSGPTQGDGDARAVPERLVELYKNRRDLAGFNEGEIAYAGQFSDETLTIAQLIAEYEESGRWEEAEALRRGGPLPKTTQIPIFDAALERAAETVGGAIAGGFDRYSQNELVKLNLAMSQGEAVSDLVQTSVDFTIDQLTEAAREAGDAGQRFLSELEEWRHLSRPEAFERFNQAILGGFTPTSPGLFDFGRAAEGLAGNQTYSGSDHFLLQPLPERYREEFGGLLEQALTVAVIGGFAAGAIASGVGAPWFAVALIGLIAELALADLDNEDSNLANILTFVIEDAERLIQASDLDGPSIHVIRETAEQAVAGGVLPPVPVR